jgi:hypothetical protein
MDSTDATGTAPLLIGASNSTPVRATWYCTSSITQSEHIRYLKITGNALLVMLMDQTLHHRLPKDVQLIVYRYIYDDYYYYVRQEYIREWLVGDPYLTPPGVYWCEYRHCLNRGYCPVANYRAMHPMNVCGYRFGRNQGGIGITSFMLPANYIQTQLHM